MHQKLNPHQNSSQIWSLKEKWYCFSWYDLATVLRLNIYIEDTLPISSLSNLHGSFYSQSKLKRAPSPSNNLLNSLSSDQQCVSGVTTLLLGCQLARPREILTNIAELRPSLLLFKFFSKRWPIIAFAQVLFEKWLSLQHPLRSTI